MSVSALNSFSLVLNLCGSQNRGTIWGLAMNFSGRVKMNYENVMLESPLFCAV